MRPPRIRPLVALATLLLAACGLPGQSPTPAPIIIIATPTPGTAAAPTAGTAVAATAGQTNPAPPPTTPGAAPTPPGGSPPKRTPTLALDAPPSRYTRILPERHELSS